MNFITLSWILGAFALLLSSGNEARADEPVDTLTACASLPHLVLLAANRDEPGLKCVTADLAGVNYVSRTVTYIWHINGHILDKMHCGRPGEVRRCVQPRENITLVYVVNKDHPDLAVGFQNFDTTNPIQAGTVYSDYETCVIESLLLGNTTVCLLWVTPVTVDAVPQACSDAMNEKCGSAVILYTDDTCQ